MKYGLLFLTAAVLLVTVAVVYGGIAWSLIWAATSFGIVGLGYLRLGPGVFAKRPDGRQGICNVVILLPFLLYVWCVWHLLRRVKRESAFDELLPDVLIGRRLLAHELPVDVTNIVDLTSEFPEPGQIAQRPGYRCFPTLDATAPPPETVLRIVSEINAMDGHVLIHCAEGHGRTGLVAAVLLVERGVCDSPADAIVFIQQRRPLVRLNTMQQQCLTECVTRISTSA